MDLNTEVKKLLHNIGPGRMRSTAYDTAWVARLVELDESIGFQALEWLREHQLPDGSWGAKAPHYHHDRLICTLAAMSVLGRWGNDQDLDRLRRARIAMDRATKGVGADMVGETIGFEMVVPSLLGEVNELGILRRQSDTRLIDMIFPGRYSHDVKIDEETGIRNQNGMLGRLVYGREAKLKALPKGRINRHFTHAFSAEMAGTDGIHILDLDQIQESNGSVGHSPAATAHFVVYGRKGDPAALDYLKKIASDQGSTGGIPDVAPFDVFERGWSLWNLALVGDLDDEIVALSQPHLDFLEAGWNPGRGIGFGVEYTPKDSDCSSLTYEVLTKFGRTLDTEALLWYEEDEYFRCFAHEANPSISVNIHMLGGLREAGFDPKHPSVEKIHSFMLRTRFADSFWLDKWHSSPYYPTSHAIIIANNYLHELIEPAIDWLVQTQNPDGSWGFYMPTAEETAYSLQALMVCKHSGKAIPADIISRGLRWLREHTEPPYPPLWIGKCLYSPTLAIRSAILSALMLGEQE